MTDKERLEIIKMDNERYHQEVVFSSQVLSDIKWLINRVEELEEEVEKQKNRKYLKMRQRDDFMKKAQRYKQALEFYADEENYKENLITKAEYDADGICISNDESAPPIIYFDR